MPAVWYAQGREPLIFGVRDLNGEHDGSDDIQEGSSSCRNGDWPAWVSCTRRYVGSGLGLSQAKSRVCGWSRALG